MMIPQNSSSSGQCRATQGMDHRGGDQQNDEQIQMVNHFWSEQCCKMEQIRKK